MEYLEMDGKKIPAIAIGTWSWGTGINGGNNVFGNNLQERDLKPVYEKAIAQGFTLWDTAPVYGMGAAETILGKFVSDNKDIIVSTKFMPLGIQLKSALSNSLDKSLRRMHLDHADIFWIHAPKNVKKWTKELIPLMKNEKIKHAGVSNHNLEEIKLAKSILEKEGLELFAVQNHYSLLYRQSEEAGIIDWCKKNHVVFFSYMVMEQGALTGQYNTTSPFKSGTRRGRAFTPKVLAQLEGLTSLMKKIGEKYQVETAQIAVAWALAKGTVPIIGMTKPHHVDGAAKALNVELTKSEILQLEKIAKATGVEIKGSWEQYMK